MKILRKISVLLSCLLFAFCSLLVGISLLNPNAFLKTNNNGAIAPDTAQAATSPTYSSYWTDSVSYINTSWVGLGTKDDPYIISSAAELAGLSYKVSTGTSYSGKYFRQTANVDVSAYYWQPIGIYYNRSGTSMNRYFYGNYDGCGHTVSGVYTKAGTTNAYSYQALFGYVSSATIQNIGLISSSIQGSNYVGGIVGYGSSTEIRNCYSMATVTGAGDYVGGIVGQLYGSGKLECCYNTGNVTSTGTEYIGGVVGYASCNISYCYNTGEVNGSGNTGGVVGILNSSSYSITNCYNTGTIIASGTRVGGIVGYSSCTVKNCYNIGQLKSSVSEAGGVVGYATNSTVINCYNAGNIDSASDYIGGVVGFVSSATLANCYNLSSVTGRQVVGGLVGRFYSGTFSNSYNAGYVSGTSRIGGVVGYQDAGTVSNCYYGGYCTLDTGFGYGSGTATKISNLNSTSYAKSQYWHTNPSNWNSSYPWDFTSVWQIDSSKNSGYPSLKSLNITYTVVYHTNYGTDSTSSHYPFTYGKPENIKLNSFTREGYTFQGWSTSPSSSEVEYADGTFISTPSLASNIAHLYAVWKANEYTLTADANLSGASFTSTPTGWSGSGTTRTKSVAFDSIYETLPSVIRTGYTFRCWATASSINNCDEDSENADSIESAYKVTTNNIMDSVHGKTIYAHWHINYYTLTINPNGGKIDGSTSNQTRDVKYNSSYGSLPTPTRDGYLFKGWYTSSSGGSSVNSSTTMGAGKTTIYAQWEPTWAANAVNLSLSNLKGNGTENNPYLIESEAQFALLALKLSKGERLKSSLLTKAYFKQMKTLNFSGKTWLPIGNETYPFDGEYDGNGYLIKNVNTLSTGSVSYSNVGLFGYTNGAKLKNINLVTGTINGANNVGLIIGNMNTGYIENCQSGARVIGQERCGLVGQANSATIKACYNYGGAKERNYKDISGSIAVGGILGENNGGTTTIENCFARCDLNATRLNGYVGGILGYSNAGYCKIISSGFCGTVSGSGSFVKLIAGGVKNETYSVIKDCIAITSSNKTLSSSSKIISSSIYEIVGTGKYCVQGEGDFSNWVLLKVDSQPIPNGLTWLGNTGVGGVTMDLLTGKLDYTSKTS